MTSGRGGGIGNHRRTDEALVSVFAKSRSGSPSPACAKFGVVPADSKPGFDPAPGPTVGHREASKSASSADSARASIFASSRKSHTLARRRSSRPMHSGASEESIGYDLIIVYYIFSHHSILFKQPKRKHRSLEAHVVREIEIDLGRPMFRSEAINMFFFRQRIREPRLRPPEPRLRHSSICAAARVRQEEQGGFGKGPG
jgi:hypothetical protein